MAVTIDQHDHVLALGRLAKFADDHRKLAAIAAKGAGLTAAEAHEANRIMTTDYATELAESLNAALDLIHRLQHGSTPPIAAADGKAPKSFFARLAQDEALADSIAVEAEDRMDPGAMTTPTYTAGYTRGVADYAAYLRTGEGSPELLNVLG